MNPGTKGKRIPATRFLFCFISYGAKIASLMISLAQLVLMFEKSEFPYKPLLICYFDLPLPHPA